MYVPSMLIREGYLYAISDTGVAICYQLATGKPIWKQRLDATFTSSPVLVGELIIVTGDDGKTFIYKAIPEKFQLVAENDLGAMVIATPAICASPLMVIRPRSATQITGRSSWEFTSKTMAG